MAAGWPDDLTQEVRCSVCFKPYDQPCRLDCGHFFCKGCLLGINRASSNPAVIVCPECRAEHQLSVPGPVGVGKLSVDHSKRRLVDMYREEHGHLGEPTELDESDGDFAYVTARETRAAEGNARDVGDQFEQSCLHVRAERSLEVFDGYVPFEIQPHDTEALFERWKSSLWLSPRDFSEKATLQVVRAAYLPFFVYSVEVQTTFRASVYVPQESGHRIPIREPTITTSVSRPENMQLVETKPPHPSRKWQTGAVGMSVKQKMQRGLAAEERGWATWLWEHAAPWLGKEGGHYDSHGKKAAPGVCKTGDSAVSPPPQVRLDNCEAQLKVGQTFVSARMPRERKIELNGRYSNKYADIVVCSSHAVDHDLVAGLVSAQSKRENDLSTLRPLDAIRSAPVDSADYERYLNRICQCVFGPDPITEPAFPASRAPASQLDEFFSTPAVPRNPSPTRERLGSPKRVDSGADLSAFFAEDTERVASNAILSDLYGLECGSEPRSEPRSSPAAACAGGITVREDHFGAVAGARGTMKAQMLGQEVLQAERSSAEVWDEQILPHVRTCELGFTNDWVESQAPKGAVVDECETEMTVYSLEHRAVLLPCFLGTYTYEGNWYEVLIHGRSGQVHGKRPWLGEGTYENVKDGVKGRMESLRDYLQSSLPKSLGGAQM